MRRIRQASPGSMKTSPALKRRTSTPPVLSGVCIRGGANAVVMDASGWKSPIVDHRVLRTLDTQNGQNRWRACWVACVGTSLILPEWAWPMRCIAAIAETLIREKRDDEAPEF